MRLSPAEVAAIKAAAREAFGDGAVVRLFGSRVDDSARGGDIDLHVEADHGAADLAHAARFRSLLWQALDEEQVDVVVRARDAAPSWLDRAARREGVIL
jgi:predicted nucleotidyltransferase